MAKSSFQQIFVDVPTRQAFLSFQGPRHITLLRPVTNASMERISDLTFKPTMQAKFLASSNTLVVGRYPYKTR